MNRNIMADIEEPAFVNATAMAEIVKQIADSQFELVPDRSWLLECVCAAGLTDHEYAALIALCECFHEHGVAMLSAVTTTAWN